MNLGARILTCAVVGLIVGGIFGGIAGASAGGVGTIIIAIIGCGLIGALLFGLLGFIPGSLWDTLVAAIDCAECCSMLTVFFIVSVITISSFVVWHSLLLAVLVGISVMAACLILLSIAIYIQKRKYESQLPQARVAVN
ncbi:MAG TPA: hypothetical protein VFB12_27305 [Ktedonobacteraceae bacterium]|nr:hypothetical protein [Ktedonobacteraceae bacterium]